MNDHEFVVPVFGDSPYLGRCVDSLLRQTVGSSIILSTSTPTRSVRAFADGAGLELRVNPVGAGIGSDWNFALQHARARFVTLAHQDDLYEPEFLRSTLELFGRFEGARLCFTGHVEVDDEGRATTSRVSVAKRLLAHTILGSRTLISAGRLRAFLSLGNPLPCSSVTLDREGLGAFRFDETLASNLDWEAWLRLAGQGERFVHAPQPLVGRRRNPLTATSRLIRDGRRRREDEMLFRRLWPSPIAYVIAQVYRLSYA